MQKAINWANIDQTTWPYGVTWSLWFIIVLDKQIFFDHWWSHAFFFYSNLDLLILWQTSHVMIRHLEVWRVGANEQNDILY